MLHRGFVPFATVSPPQNRERKKMLGLDSLLNGFSQILRSEFKVAAFLRVIIFIDLSLPIGLVEFINSICLKS